LAAISITTFARRDQTDRADLHGAALAATRALRAQEGVIGSRFFWDAQGDAVVIITEYDSMERLNTRPSTAAMAALYRLADLGRPAGSSRLTDARDAASAYLDAGRS